MKKSLLLLVLASAAALGGCVTPAGYRGHGDGYYGSSDYYRSSRSDPYGYYGGGGSYYGYDRYGYDSYGRSYGTPYGYAPYYNNNRYYYYYPTPQRPPTTGTDTPPPQLDPNRPYRDNSRYRRAQLPSSPPEDSGLSRDLSRYRGVRQEAPAPVYQERSESVPSVIESPRRTRPVRQQSMPSIQQGMPSMPSRSRTPAPARSAPNPASVLDQTR